MFESISEKLESIFKKLKGKGLIGEEDIDAALKEVRLALLEADVNFKVVKDFVQRIKEKALGKERGLAGNETEVAGAQRRAIARHLRNAVARLRGLVLRLEARTPDRPHHLDLPRVAPQPRCPRLLPLLRVRGHSCPARAEC